MTNKMVRVIVFILLIAALLISMILRQNRERTHSATSWSGPSLAGVIS